MHEQNLPQRPSNKILATSAAYLGFGTPAGYITFVDRDISRVARRYSMSYLEHRKNFSTTGNKRSQRQDNVKDLWSLVSILDREHYGLQQRLLRTGATIVWKGNSRPIRSTDEDEGFSHEDWFCANVCLQRYLLRRQKHKNITIKDTTGDIKDWPGFIQPAAGPNNDEEDDDDNEPPDANIIRSLEAEHTLLGDDWLNDMPLDSDKYAKQSDIIDAFGEEVADQFEFDSTTERVQNFLVMLAEYITTGISAMLVEANPSCDPFEEGEKQRAKLKLPPPKYPSDKALGYLHDMLLKRAHVAYDKTLPRSELAKLRPSNEDVDPEYQTASNQLELQRGAQDLELTEEDPNTSNRQFHGVQNLLGEFLPNHDLEQVCREVGITDWRTLELNPEHAPVTLGSLKQTQQLFDQLAQDHEDLMAARTIILCAYHTAIRRFATVNGEVVGRSKLGPDPGLQIDDDENDLDDEDLEVQDTLDDDEAVVLRKLALKNVQLYRLVLDEGHAVKNVKSIMNQILQQMEYDAIMIASATILSNHIRDFYGYIELIWDKDLPFSWDDCTSEKAGTWTKDKVVVPPNLTARQIQREEEYRRHIKDTGEPLFLMNPQLFYSFANSSRHSPLFAQSAICTIMQMLCVRRSMLSQMTLPDGSVTWPGKGIPALLCNEVELNLPEQVKPKLHQAIRRLHANLITQGPRVKKFKSGHGAKVSGPAVQWNCNVLRRMVLASTNVHNLKMTSPLLRTTKLLKDIGTQKIMGHQVKDAPHHRHNKKPRPLLTSSVDDPSEVLTPMQEKQREGLQRRQRPEAAAGTAEMNRVAASDPTMGLQWEFYLTRDSARELFPEAAINRVLELHLKGERVLVYVNNPLTSAMILAMLEALGIRTLSIQTPLSHPSSCQVSNLGTQIQAIGRLWRTNQEKEVHWWVLHQRDSYDAFVDARNLEKYATTLAAEGNINDSITDEYRVTCAYEILRCYLGQESNRYPRLRVAWFKMDTEKVRLEGFFYTAIARFLFRNPDRQDRLTPETIGDIAARWELGSEITIAHVEPGHPDCPPTMDPDNPGCIILSSVREQEKAFRENMAMYGSENPNNDVLGDGSEDEGANSSDVQMVDTPGSTARQRKRKRDNELTSISTV
ncbi:unnamed protein product [Fusarium graminearum]|nr:unnamed protein product [Fusarium graminearum]CAG1987784.1 unnamed protein product [Fusarium graminearum]